MIRQQLGKGSPGKKPPAAPNSGPTFKGGGAFRKTHNLVRKRRCLRTNHGSRIAAAQGGENSGGGKKKKFFFGNVGTNSTARRKERQEGRCPGVQGRKEERMALEKRTEKRTLRGRGQIGEKVSSKLLQKGGNFRRKRSAPAVKKKEVRSKEPEKGGGMANTTRSVKNVR